MSNLTLNSMLVVVGLCVGTAAGFAQPATPWRPTLELEKTVYGVGESVRFWIGVSSSFDIPEDLQGSSIVHWANPDGSKLDEKVSPTTDGDPKRSWKGGWGFGTRSPSPGRYTVSFEFAGQKTPELSFDIISDPTVSLILAEWIFDKNAAGSIHDGRAILHVENRTNRVLRFAKPGLTGSGVYLTVKGPRFSSSTFVPQSALVTPEEIPTFLPDLQLDWDSQSKWPMITVPAGGSTDRSVALQSVFPFQAGQDYELTLDTVLTIFVGESTDADAQRFPLRLPVTETTTFHW